MSRPFESFELQNSGWDARVLESMSPRSVFLCLVGLVFVLGFDATAAIYDLIRHRFEWSNFIICFVLGLLAFRYARLIYRRLGR